MLTAQPPLSASLASQPTSPRAWGLATMRGGWGTGHPSTGINRNHGFLPNSSDITSVEEGKEKASYFSAFKEAPEMLEDDPSWLPEEDPNPAGLQRHQADRGPGCQADGGFSSFGSLDPASSRQDPTQDLVRLLSLCSQIASCPGIFCPLGLLKNRRSLSALSASSCTWQDVVPLQIQ